MADTTFDDVLANVKQEAEMPATPQSAPVPATAPSSDPAQDMRFNAVLGDVKDAAAGMKDTIGFYHQQAADKQIKAMGLGDNTANDNEPSEWKKNVNEQILKQFISGKNILSALATQAGNAGVYLATKASGEGGLFGVLPGIMKDIGGQVVQGAEKVGGFALMTEAEDIAALHGKPLSPEVIKQYESIGANPPAWLTSPETPEQKVVAAVTTAKLKSLGIPVGEKPVGTAGQVTSVMAQMAPFVLGGEAAIPEKLMTLFGMGAGSVGLQKGAQALGADQYRQEVASLVGLVAGGAAGTLHSALENPPLMPETARAVNNGIAPYHNAPWDIKDEAAAWQANQQAGARIAENRQIADLQAKIQSDPQKAAVYQAQIDKIMASRQSAPQPAPDIHTLARTIAPDVMTERDQLQRRAAQLQEILNPAERRAQAEANAPHTEEINKLQAGLDKGEYDPKKARRVQAKINELTAANEAHISEAMQDTPELAAARAELANVRERQAAVGQKVYAAYQQAEAQMPKAPEPVPAEPAARAAPQVEDMRDAIASDIQKKLVKLGRAPEEAEAQSRIAASFYQTMAELYGGARGTAMDWYQREAPEVKATRAQKAVLAQKPELPQITRGRIRLATDDAKAVITLVKSADASTFMHESAHHFFDIMNRLAQEEDAPEQLKADVATFRKYMDIPEGADVRETITKASGRTKFKYENGLERFATGFEQYLREGVAPSPELAGVFAKFKAWLTNIYQTIKKLGVPINDDVRQAFDRMLSSEPKRTIIAPEEEPGKMLAGIHAADAENTPPEHADKVGDTAEQEVVKTAGALTNADATDAIENAGQANAVTETAASNTEAGARPEPAAGGQAAPAEPAPVATGGGKAAPEGATVRGKRLIAPDGRIDTDAYAKLGANEFLKRFNAELASLDTKSELAKKFSFEDTVKLADLKAIAEQMNMTVDQMMNIQTDYGSLTERPLLRAGAYILMKQLHEEMMAKAQDAVANGKAESVADFLRSYEKREELLNAYKTTESLSKEAGVHLVASKIIEAIDVTQAKEMGAVLNQIEKMEKEGKGIVSKSDADKMDKLINNIAGMDKSEDVAGLLAKVNKPTFWDKFLEWRMAALVSGEVTHFSYAIGNLALNLYNALIEDSLAAVVDRVAGAFGKEQSGDALTAGFRNLHAQLKYAPNILSATGTALRTGKTVLLPHEEYMSKSELFDNIRKTTGINPDVLKAAVDAAFKEENFPDLAPLRAKINDPLLDERGHNIYQTQMDLAIARKKAELTKIITAEMQTRVKTWGDIYDSSRDFLISQASALRNMAQDTAAEALKHPGQVAKGAAALPFKAVIGAARTIYSTLHTFQRYSVMYGKFANAAYRQAAKEGLSGIALENRVQQLFSTMPKELMEPVTKEANELSFMNRDSEYTRQLNMFLDNAKLGNVPIGRIVAPITTVPTNIAVETVLKRTPFGALDTKIRADLSGENGAVARNQAWGKMLGGIGLVTTFYTLAQAGLATPSAPAQYGRQTQLKMAGRPPNSIRIGDWWVNIQSVPILSNLATLGADLHYIRNIAMGEDESETLQAASYNAVKNFALHENAIVSIADAVDAISGHTSIINYFENQALSVAVPALVKQTNELNDPYQRQYNTFMDKLKARVPGWSEDVEPRINALTGEPLKQQQGYIPATRFYQTPATQPDPIAVALTQLRMFPANPRPNLNGVALSPKQAMEYSSVKGHILHDGLQDLIEGDGREDFEAASDNDKRKMIHKREVHAAQCAKAVMFNRYPELLKDANDKYEESCQAYIP